MIYFTFRNDVGCIRSRYSTKIFSLTSIYLTNFNIANFNVLLADHLLSKMYILL